MLVTPTCFKWDGSPCSYDYLQGIYKFAIHDGLDHIPANATQAWYPTILREQGGKRTLFASADAPLILIGAGYTFTYDDGRLTFPMENWPPEKSHAYQPRKGERGTLGIKVVASKYPSAYIDQLGIAWDAHEPSQLPPAEAGNSYMHVNVTFELVDLDKIDVPPPVVPPVTPPATGDYVRIPYSLALEMKRHAAASADLDAEITKYLNQRPG